MDALTASARRFLSQPLQSGILRVPADSAETMSVTLARLILRDHPEECVVIVCPDDGDHVNTIMTKITEDTEMASVRVVRIYGDDRDGRTIAESRPQIVVGTLESQLEDNGIKGNYVIMNRSEKLEMFEELGVLCRFIPRGFAKVEGI